jgi:hypothetical protein
VVRPAERVTAQIASQHIDQALHASGPPLATKAAPPGQILCRPENSIVSLTCPFACDAGVVMVG